LNLEQAKEDRGAASEAAALLSLPCLFETTQCKPTKNAIAKKAETLFLNLSNMIERKGIDRVGFVTLTFADNVTDRDEAQRRFNSFSTNFLRPRVDEFIACVERQSRGAIHYHLVTAFPYDIRTGFDFVAARDAANARRVGDVLGEREHQRRYYRSANARLAEWWRTVREAAPRYGFGRCETLPVLSNSAAIARYVGSYVSTELAHREARDKGLRTIRYSMREQVTTSDGETFTRSTRCASIRWQWVAGQGETWRRGCQVLSVMLGTDDFEETLGNRWSWNWREEISLLGKHYADTLRLANECFSDNNDFAKRCEAVAKVVGVLKHYEELESANEKV